jgi:predicted Fe-Mo cluster-binding NifX family protein/NAD-dependent dihydropyrimidine dehydrogenase PreA subunit
MKVAATSTGSTLDDDVEARFGRCAYFLVVDMETMHCEPMENPNIALGGGAGIQSAQLLSEKGVTTVLTGNCGPNAFEVFGRAGIEVIVGIRGPVRNAVEQFRRGAFSSALRPDIASHFGLTASSSNATPRGQSTTSPLGQRGGTGFGTGGGRGVGRGLKGGRSMGKGRGCGGGMGKGMGRGMGRGLGMSMGAGFETTNWPPGYQAAFPSGSDPDPAQRKASLHDQVRILEEQKHQIEQRINELETGHRSVAVVVSENCIGCGICMDACSAGAIHVKEKAGVNEDLCIGCAACVPACPNEAIIMAQKEFRK